MAIKNTAMGYVLKFNIEKMRHQNTGSVCQVRLCQFYAKLVYVRLGQVSLFVPLFSEAEKYLIISESFFHVALFSHFFFQCHFFSTHFSCAILDRVNFSDGITSDAIFYGATFSAANFLVPIFNAVIISGAIIFCCLFCWWGFF